MNKKETARTKNKNLEQIDSNLGFHKFFCVRINAGNSYEHEKKKFDIAYRLAKENHVFVTEAKSKNGKRKFDVFDATTGEIYEVETGKSYEKQGSNIIRVEA